MLDIEYIKQIDEVLDVEGFYLIDSSTSICIGFKAGSSRKVFINFMESNYTQHVYYPLYLDRVIRAINKKYNVDNNCFCYRIIQKDDLIEVLFINEHCESYSGLTDESKESAIQYIMDHIKDNI